jgi:hypothetical protein
MKAVSKTVTNPGRSEGFPASAGKSGYRLQRLSATRPGQFGSHLRRAIAPHLLVSLDSLVPPPLANAGFKVRCHLSNILTLAHHAAAHLIAVSINCKG